MHWLIEIGKFNNHSNDFCYYFNDYSACKYLYENGLSPMSQNLINIFYANHIFYAIKCSQCLYKPDIDAFYQAIGSNNVESLTFLCELLINE